MRIRGIEPLRPDWKSEMLPLHHTRIKELYNIFHYAEECCNIKKRRRLGIKGYLSKRPLSISSAIALSFSVVFLTSPVVGVGFSVALADCVGVVSAGVVLL